MEHYGIRDDLVAWRVVDGEAILVHAETSAYYGLNPSATQVWLTLADSEACLESLATFLADRYEVDAASAARDVAALVEALGAEGLVSPVPGSSDGSGSPAREAGAVEEPKAAYERPAIERLGHLETLILSGE